MKRVLCGMVALLLLCTAGFRAFGAAGVAQNQTTLVGLEAFYEKQPGESLLLQVNPQLLGSGEGAWGVDSEDLAFQVAVASGLEGQVAVWIDGQKSASQVWFSPNTPRQESYLTVTALPRGVSDDPFASASGEVVVTAYSRTTGERAASSSFLLEIIPGIGAWTGFSPGSVSLSGAILPGEGAIVPLGDHWFLYRDGEHDNQATLEMALTYGLTASVEENSSQAAFQLGLEEWEGRPAIRLLPDRDLEPGSSVELKLRLTAANSAFGEESKELSLHLTAADVRGDEVDPGADGSAARILGIAENARLDAEILVNGTAVESPEGLALQAGDEIRLPIDASFFRWEESFEGAIPLEALIAAGVDVRVAGNHVDKFVDGAEMVWSPTNCYVRLRFVDHFVSTDVRDFQLIVSISLNEVRHVGSQLVLSGTVGNDSILLTGADRSVDLSGGVVAYAENTIDEMEVYLGAGVVLTTQMTPNTAYYGYASVDDGSTGTEEGLLPEHYEEIAAIYRLKTINLGGDLVRVRLSDVDPEYSVYSNEGEYLGTAGEELPYSIRYIVTSVPIALTGIIDGTTVLEEETFLIEEEAIPLASFGDIGEIVATGSTAPVINAKLLSILAAVVATACISCAVVLIRRPEQDR